jgi:hypothetical protein
MLQISKTVNDFQVALSAEIEPVAGESEDQISSRVHCDHELHT